MAFKNTARTGICLAVLLLASACNLSHPSYMTEERIELTQERVSKEYPTASLSGATLQALAKHYSDDGQGEMRVTVLYDPFDETNTAMKASDHVSRLSSDLRKLGVNNLDLKILPVKGNGAISKTLVSYNALQAQAPSGCREMDGVKDNDITLDTDYKLGCGIKAQIAQQVARTKDLLGFDKTDTDADGRRAGNVVEVYRMGEGNEPLAGESASE